LKVGHNEWVGGGKNPCQESLENLFKHRARGRKERTGREAWRISKDRLKVVGRKRKGLARVSFSISKGRTDLR